MDLTRQRFVIFGGSSGIGLGVARAAIAAGASVVIVGRSREKLVAATLALGNSPRVVTSAANIASETDVKRVFAENSGVDHIVVTAVDAAYQAVRDFDVDAARRVIDSKLLGALLVAKHGAPHLRSGGSFTFTSGVAADRPAPGGSMIAAVNGALASFVRALALELAPLRANVVSPGWVDTPVWDTIVGANKTAVQTQMAQRLPVRRIGRVEDIAEAVLFLTQSPFTTGSVLHIDGGHRLV